MESGSQQKKNRRAKGRLSLTWTGNEWNIECAVPAEKLRSHYTFSVTVPKKALLPKPRPKPAARTWKLLFDKDTWLYLPVRAVRDQTAIGTMIGRHFSEIGRNLPSGDRISVPIRLLEPLYILKPKGYGDWPTGKCKCRIEGEERVFTSLHQLAKHALILWTNRRTGSTDVFHDICFYHKGGYWPIDRMRDHVVHNGPLPANDEKDDDTLPLPGMDTF